MVAAASEALKLAYCKGIFVLAMSSLGFGVVAIVACLLCKDVESKMTNTVSVLYKIICTIEMLTFMRLTCISRMMNMPTGTRSIEDSTG